jgi:hypothetical protein
MPQSKVARVWFRVSALSFTLLAGITFVQVSTFTRDLDHTCEAAGQALDINYRLRHQHDGTFYFPLQNRCNPVYDTVPQWVNPVLAILAAVLAIALTGALVTYGEKKPRPVRMPSRPGIPHPERKAHRAPLPESRRTPRSVPSRQ